MSIKIFLTGGTFDKEYNELNGELFFKDTHVPEMLLMGKNRVPVKTETLMMIDSLEMTDDDRQMITKQVVETSENQVIITHGTDTMVETAHVIARTVKDKTVILMGAMIPYRFGGSDGLFNLGAAIAFVQTLSPGVYICMNGRYFNYDNCRKNREKGEFEEIK